MPEQVSKSQRPVVSEGVQILDTLEGNNKRSPDESKSAVGPGYGLWELPDERERRRANATLLGYLCIQ